MVLFWPREDGLADVEADLGRVDVEGGDDLDVAHVVAAELHVHEAGDGLGRVGVAVVLQALHQRAGAVADSRDGQPDGLRSLLSSQIWMGLTLRLACRSMAIRRSSQEMSRSAASVP